MPIPQVNDRIKEAPVVVLRAVFAGIGQLLLTADKVRARAAEQVWTPEQPAGPGPAGPSASWSAATTMTAPATKTAPAGTATATTKPAPAAKASAVTKTAPAAKATATTKPTSAGQLASTRKPASTSKPASPAKPVSSAKPASAAKTAPAARPDQAPTAAHGDKATRAAEVPATEPPLPGYDDLSLPSLRARLRTLDAPAIEGMLAYEKAHARRDDVTTMLERRLAKITTE
jgi:hypothetical protein